MTHQTLNFLTSRKLKQNNDTSNTKLYNKQKTETEVS